MRTYDDVAPGLGLRALEACLSATSGRIGARDVTDLVAVSCTGYSAPGLDIGVARALGMAGDVRRTLVGHMGCYGALVGLRECAGLLRARPEARAALLSVELSTLPCAPTVDPELLTAFALFGDAAAAALLRVDAQAQGPELVDTRSEADYTTAEQMSWTIGDAGFTMGLSPRVPVSLKRVVRGVVERLLEPHGLAVGDVAHWLGPPGGPRRLGGGRGRREAVDEPVAPPWAVLRRHGQCPAGPA